MRSAIVAKTGGTGNFDRMSEWRPRNQKTGPKRGQKTPPARVTVEGGRGGVMHV